VQLFPQVPQDPAEVLSVSQPGAELQSMKPGKQAFEMTHSSLTQAIEPEVGSTPAKAVQLLAQAPQRVVVLVTDSQPLPRLPSQSLYPVAQLVKEQALLEQVTALTLLTDVVQSVPQAPQEVGEVAFVVQVLLQKR